MLPLPDAVYRVHETSEEHRRSTCLHGRQVPRKMNSHDELDRIASDDHRWPWVPG